ncbi:hypothetical protein AB0C28_08770 [Nonomuraea sp. NPDC048892]|uniref:hypothetical protein n=1 Tax=Nonomuraea sp. NPDC048892 TaxID=3154624 RepID=UPI003410DEB2
MAVPPAQIRARVAADRKTVTPPRRRSTSCSRLPASTEAHGARAGIRLEGALVLTDVALQTDGQPGRVEHLVHSVGDVLGVVGAQPHRAELVGEQADVGGEVPAGLGQRGYRVGSVIWLNTRIEPRTFLCCGRSWMTAKGILIPAD